MTTPRGGRPVFTATVSPSLATGTVSFKDNGRVVKTVSVTGGSAIYQATGQTRGTHSMTAVYSGDGSTLASTSPVVKVTVRGLTSSTALAANDRDFPYGYRPLLTSSVAPSGATGTVTFRDGSRVLGTVTVTRGKAALRAPVLSRGTHSLTAAYNGSGIYNPSVSVALGVRVR